MKRKVKIFAYLFVLLLLSIVIVFNFENANSWGFEAHRKITELAINLILNLDGFNGLTTEQFNSLKKFLSENKNIIIERCIEPDMVRDEDKDEQYNHFIDIDRYGKYPFAELPREKSKAIEKFGFETVKKNGFLPWRIAEFSDSLSYAVAKSDREKTLKYTSWLAHYVEDAHVPLHTTENYDGQLTNQPGIHSRFETELVRFLISKNDLKFDLKELSDKLKTKSLINDKVNFAFAIVLDSYNLVDDILSADNYAKSQIPSEKLYRVEKRNGRTRYIYSDEYYSIMSEKLKNLLHRQMSEASVNLALIWLSSWKDAYRK